MAATGAFPRTASGTISIVRVKGGTPDATMAATVRIDLEHSIRDLS
jgi:hypothetical protein